MQETRYIDEDGNQQTLEEIFHAQQGDKSQQDIINRMNNRLFELEEKGHALVSQMTFSEKRALERAKKARKKLNRMKSKGMAV